ncbi:MAG: VOC family protein [Actinomycetota bacterium]
MASGPQDDSVTDWARPVVHWAIEAVDPERQRAFYSAIFNWDIDNGVIMNVPPGLGGPEPGPAGHIQPGDTSRFVIYVQVRDLESARRRVETLGGAVHGDPFDVPGGPTLAAIADPEGNPLMLVQQ